MRERTELIGSLAFHLTRAGYFLATAESCTGGLVAASCTDIAGSSEWFKGGIIAYADAIKETLLGVPHAVLAEHGAVSGPVVCRMALGALERCGAQAAIGISGIAGPGGGTGEKPVGTVWIGVAVQEREGVCLFDTEAMAGFFPECRRESVNGKHTVVYAMCHHFEGDRADVRDQAVDAGLEDLLRLLVENTIPALP